MTSEVQATVGKSRASVNVQKAQITVKHYALLKYKEKADIE